MTDNILRAADRKIDELLSVRARQPHSPTLTRDALADLSDEIGARLDGHGRELFDRYESACVEHECVAVEAGYTLGVKVCRRRILGRAAGAQS
jgi:hypothetical protein